jgi:hypothetical protein
VSRSIGLLPQVWSPPKIHPTLVRKSARAAVILAALTGCGGERTVAVRVSVPDADSLETPAAGVGVIALPYDRDSVLASLDARARTPRPNTAALDSLFARFRGPFTRYTRLSYAASRLRDSLNTLRKAQDAIAPDSPEHRSFTVQVRRLSDSLSSTERTVERARAELDRARREFISRSDSLRARVRQWEDSTYRGWDSIVQSLTTGRGLEAATDTTGASGWAEFRLGRGSWWLYARAWDTSDPNAEWYWNVPVTEDTVLLSSRTGERRPRY